MNDHGPARTRSVAILGSRGIPAEFGGFETFAEQLAVRLVARGYEVTVFCEYSQSYREPDYKGVRLVYLRTPAVPGLRSIWFDSVCILRSLRGYDAVLMLGYHAAFAFVLPWLLRNNFITNMDGIEWKRDKWSSAAKLYIRSMEFCAAHLSRRLVADAQGIAEHLQTHHGVHRKITTIPYGAEPVNETPDPSFLEDLSLTPDSYYLLVCRLEPENHVLEIIRGFVQSDSPYQLVIVGDHQAQTEYTQALLRVADARVRFMGVVFHHATLQSLRWYCRAYFHGHSVGGTNPSLLEAMACGNHTVAHDNVFNREVTAGNADFFTSAADVTTVLSRLDRAVPNVARELLRQRVRNIYSWDAITDQYERLLFTRD